MKQKLYGLTLFVCMLMRLCPIAFSIETGLIEQFRKSPQVSEPLKSAYTPMRDTILVENCKVNAVLLIPPDKKYAALASKIQRRLKEMTGYEFPTASEAGFIPDGRVMILYGNCFTGPISRHLYSNELIVADELYPGAGYEFRTVASPLHYKGNVLFIGGSSPDKVLKTLERAEKVLKKGDTIKLPIIIDIKIDKDVPSLPSDDEFKLPYSPSDEEIEKKAEQLKDMLAGFRSNKIYHALSALNRAGRDYYLTGDDAFGKLYARLLKVVTDFYYIEGSRPPTFALDKLITSLDQVEESTGMTPEDILRGGEFARRIVEDTMKFWEMTEPIKNFQNNEHTLLWNHQTFSLLSLAYASQYLRSHYELPATDYWDAIIDHSFEGQISYDQPLENSSHYQWLVHRHMMTWLLVTRKHQDFFEKETLKDHLKLAIASHNNMGDEPPHGDAGYGFSSAAWRPFQIAYSFYRDPIYAFLLERISQDQPYVQSLFRYNAAPPDENFIPDTGVGLTVLPCSPIRVKTFGIESIPATKVLDKAVFRSGWSFDDNYLMLSGMNVGIHTHSDANSIIQYMQGKRIWLTDLHYTRGIPKDHNLITITRDGIAQDFRRWSHEDKPGVQVKEPPYAAELIASLGNADLAFLRTRLNDYNGMDWDRSIFWTADNGFIVIDDLKAVQNGHYITNCIWRTLGTVSQDNNIIQVRQTGDEPLENFFIVNGDGSHIDLTEQYDMGHAQGEGYYEKYPYADKITKIIYQLKDESLQADDSMQYVNYFSNASGENPEKPKLKKIGDTAWILKGVKPAFISDGNFDSDLFSITADYSILSEEGILAVNAKKIMIGSEKWVSKFPEDVLIDLNKEKEIFSSAAVSGVLKKLSEKGVSPSKPSDLRMIAAEKIKPYKMMEHGVILSAIASSEGKFLVGDIQGMVTAFDKDGAQVFEHKAHGAVRAIAPIHRPEGIFWAIGTERVPGETTGTVTLLDTSGKELWRNETEFYHTTNGTVRIITGADLDGDGYQETIAGCENWHVYAYNEQGQELWRARIQHVAKALAAGDITGDKKDDIFTGAEYARQYSFDSEGKEIRNYIFGHLITDIVTDDVDNDGKAEGIYAAEDCFIHAIEPGKDFYVWSTNVGGVPTSLIKLPESWGARFAAATEGFGISFLAKDGSRTAYISLPNMVSDITISGKYMTAVCDDGYAYILDSNGTIKAKSALPPREISIYQPKATGINDGRAAVISGKHIIILDVNGLD